MQNPNAQCFLGNIKEEDAALILNITGFARGSFHVRYLGFPLISSKLKGRDCAPLVTKYCERIEIWTSRSLNFAGRLQLSTSVLASIFGYWSMYLFLPKFVLKQLNSLTFKFLWGASTNLMEMPSQGQLGRLL